MTQFLPKKTDYHINNSLVILEAKIPKLKDKQFKFFQKLIFDKAGIRMQESKNSLVSTRLARRLRINKLAGWDEYIDLLKLEHPNEIQAFINLLTTNKSEFFRENQHFEYLSRSFLPLLVAQGNLEPLFWIGACSFGQEVYTLLMVIHEYNRINNTTIDPRILATDIDTNVIKSAEQGIFEKSIVDRDINPFLIKRYFLKGIGENSGKYKFNQELAHSIKFRYHNLCDLSSTVPLTFDAIFLRNVLIYFSPETVEKVISKTLSHLKKDGLLFLGYCESIIEMKWHLNSVQQSIYRKIR